MDIPVQSSAISSLDWDEDTQDLTVVFQDGSSYVYPAFPWRWLTMWRNAGSIGGFYNARIRGRFGEREA